MSVVDVDSELLDGFLDGQLSEAQAEAVRQRLAIDSAFSRALDELIAERSTREHFYNTLQRHDSAEDEVVGRLLSRVERGLDRDERRALARSDRWRMFRYLTAAAACVMFSFSAGWIGHRHSSDGVQSGASPINDSFAAVSRNDVSRNDVSVTSNSGVGTATPSASGVDVTLTDSMGHFLATQHFESEQEAREFTQDVTRWQQEQQNRAKGDLGGNLQDAVLVKGQF